MGVIWDGTTLVLAYASFKLRHFDVYVWECGGLQRLGAELRGEVSIARISGFNEFEQCMPVLNDILDCRLRYPHRIHDVSTGQGNPQALKSNAKPVIPGAVCSR